MRALLIPLCLLAAPVFGQEQAEPLADTSLVEACLDNVSIAAADGAPFPATNCIGVASTVCMEQPGGGSTAGMISCTQQETAYWDGLLNDTYQELVAQAERMDGRTPGESPTHLDLLREMQRNWIAFRDISCQWEADLYRGGSIMGPIHANCHLQMTAEQTLRLQTQLGVEQ